MSAGQFGKAAMAVTTAGEFLAVLDRSRLLTPAELAQAHNAADDDADPKTIAKRLARQDLITRWQAGQLLAGRSSFYLGKYRLIELLGRGGMGNVFLGQHVTMNRRVALKIISRQVRKDRASLDRFLIEARAIAALDHPNIVQAYNVDNEGDRYYLVMEYVEGLDLERMVEEEGPLDWRRAADYIRQAADGLEHAHQRNVIHCDIKPSNLLVNVQGVVKILDMGLARLTHDDAAEADDQGNRVLGSVDYLAPEQAMADRPLDRRADIYSLGCTLYFALTGHPPFPTGALAERIVKHQTKEPTPIGAERPNVPAALVAVCDRMMAKRPEERLPSASDVSRLLEACRQAAPLAKRNAAKSRQRRAPPSPGRSLAVAKPATKPRPAPARKQTGVAPDTFLDVQLTSMALTARQMRFRRNRRRHFFTPWRVFGSLLLLSLSILAIAAAYTLKGDANAVQDRPKPAATKTSP